MAAVHLTVGYPMKKYDNTADIEELRATVTEMIDQLQYILCNLSDGNVLEAGSVKAQNINTNEAMINNAQIQNLNAEKIYGELIAGDELIIGNEDGSFNVNGEGVRIDNLDMILTRGKIRIYMQSYFNRPDGTIGQFPFVIQKYNETKDIWENLFYVDEDGNSVFAGNVNGGSVTSNSTIDVNTNVHIGENLYVGANGYDLYNHGTIYFGSTDTSAPQIICEADALTLTALNGVFVGNNDIPGNKIATIQDVREEIEKYLGPQL